jgi:hypothetical protein
LIIKFLGVNNTMPAVRFDRDSLARWYAGQHLRTDPGIVSVHYLPENADEREIRLIDVNRLICVRTDESLEPIDFGVDFGTDSEHKLRVVDVTPEQWERIQTGSLPLPSGWNLANSIQYP